MGNCSGLFANCQGDPNAQNAVKRIDADTMKRALDANQNEQMAGHAMAAGPATAVANDGNVYNHSQFASDAAQNLKAGDFKKDVREFRPPVHLDSGAVYEGEWFNGVRDGQGKQEWLDGSRYEGQWRNGKANG